MPHCKEEARLRTLHLWHAYSGGMLRDECLQSSRPTGTEHWKRPVPFTAEQTKGQNLKPVAKEGKV